MPTIILSYRREDTKWIVGRIFDRLERHYGTNHVFMDIDSIPFGLDFRERIQESLKRCDILVAIIGPRWASSDEHSISRLNEETDWVRIAIQTALANKIPVIPVLIDGAPLPSARELPLSIRDLAFRQAAPLDSGRDFHPHMDRLIKVMDQLLAHAKQPKAGPVSGPSARPSGAALSTERIASSGQASATTRRHVQIEAFSSLPSNEGAQTQLPLARNQSAPIRQSIGEKSVARSANHSRNLPRGGLTQ